MSKKVQIISWDTVYILGYTDPFSGKSQLTTWEDKYNTPMINVVITGSCYVPVWNNPAPVNAQIHAVPKGKDVKEYAKELSGIAAFGWYFPMGFGRIQLTEEEIVAEKSAIFKLKNL